MQHKSMMNRSSNISALFSILLLSCGGKLTTSAVSTSKQNDSSSSSSRKLQNNNVINNWSNKEQGLANLLFDKIEASKTSSPTVSPTTVQPTDVSFVSYVLQFIFIYLYVCDSYILTSNNLSFLYNQYNYRVQH